MIAEFFPLFYFYTTVKLYPPPHEKLSSFRPQFILNLLQNAKDAVSEKTFTDSKGSIFLCAEKISDSIVISCTDNGCGISDDIVNTIFDPFVTYKTNGTGLGLALSKKIIEAHGGTLIVTSSDETGTVFTITLPV